VVRKFIDKWFKDIIYVLVIVGVVGYNVYGSHLYEEVIKEQETVITYQDEQITTLGARLDIEKTKRPVKLVSCAHSQKDYIRALINEEKRYDMPKGILQNVAYHESRLNPNAISHKGAIGIMQLHPRWHKSVNPYDPYEAIQYGAKYLNSLYERFQDWEIALAAWNWGQGNISKYSFYQAPRETKEFVKKVMLGIQV